MFEKILAALYSLGATPDDIAERLAGEACYGFVKGNCSCPLFRFLERVIGECDPDIGIRESSIRVGDDLIIYDEHGLHGLEMFIANFDHGHYQHLIAAA